MPDTTETDAALAAMLEPDKPADETPTDPPADDSDDDEDGADELGDKGKQALDRMKAKLRAERERRIAAEAKANAASDADDAARIRREAETAAATKANARILKAEVKALATGKLADPTDALAFLDLSQFEVDEDGDVDTDDIVTALDDLLRRKPHLAAQGGSKTPRPDRSQGAAGTGAATTADQFAAAISKAL